MYPAVSLKILGDRRFTDLLYIQFIESFHINIELSEIIGNKKNSIQLQYLCSKFYENDVIPLNIESGPGAFCI